MDNNKLLLQELLAALIDDEDSYGEGGSVRTAPYKDYLVYSEAVTNWFHCKI